MSNLSDRVPPGHQPVPHRAEGQLVAGEGRVGSTPHTRSPARVEGVQDEDVGAHGAGGQQDH